MSTTASSPPLYAVPTPPPASRTRFAFLLRLRELGRRAFRPAMAAPRSAAGYLMRGLRTVVPGLPGPVTNTLGWIGDRLSGTAALVRSVGVLPTIGAILTVPRSSGPFSARCAGSAASTPGPAWRCGGAPRGCLSAAAH